MEITREKWFNRWSVRVFQLSEQRANRKPISRKNIKIMLFFLCLLHFKFAEEDVSWRSKHLISPVVVFSEWMFDLNRVSWSSVVISGQCLIVLV